MEKSHHSELIDIDEESYEILKKALEDGIYEEIGQFHVDDGKLFIENDGYRALNTRSAFRAFTLDQLKIHKIREQSLIELNLTLGNKHYDYSLYNNEDILIAGEVIIFEVYGVAFKTVFGPSNGEYLTERTIASFLVECWNRVLTREELESLRMEIEEENGNIINSRMTDLFPLSSVSCLVKQENHGLMADALYIVELAD